MPVATHPVSVEEYLQTVYQPDCDFVDGEILERNMAEMDHGLVQMAVGAYFYARRKEWNITVLPETRVQVTPIRFRVPDLCIVLGSLTLGSANERILTKPPFLCIEILSPEDRWSRVRERIDDFLAMGVPFIWVLDPATRAAYTVTRAEGLREVTDGVLRTSNPAFQMALDEMLE